MASVIKGRSIPGLAVDKGIKMGKNGFQFLWMQFGGEMGIQVVDQRAAAIQCVQSQLGQVRSRRPGRPPLASLR